MDDRAIIIVTSQQTSMVAADLHLGIHVKLSKEKKVAIPPQTDRILNRMIDLLNKYQVDGLYLLGDIKHSILVDEKYNWENIPKFMSRLPERVQTTIVPGNHDGEIKALLPRSVKLAEVKGTIIDAEPSIGLIHGHAWPSEAVLSSDIIIMGHIHPSIRRVRRVKTKTGSRNVIRYTGNIPIVIKARIDKDCVSKNMETDESPSNKEGVLVVLPAFNELLSGSPINVSTKTLGGPIFSNDCVETENAQVYSCNEIYLGTVLELRTRFSEMLK